MPRAECISSLTVSLLVSTVLALPPLGPVRIVASASSVVSGLPLPHSRSTSSIDPQSDHWKALAMLRPLQGPPPHSASLSLLQTTTSPAPVPSQIRESARHLVTLLQPRDPSWSCTPATLQPEGLARCGCCQDTLPPHCRPLPRKMSPCFPSTIILVLYPALSVCLCTEHTT